MATMAPYDPDMDNFFDFGQETEYHSPSSAISPTTKISPMSQTIDPMSTMVPLNPLERRQYFAGPSHEYGRFRQQTGLPSGAVSNVTQFNDFDRNGYNFHSSSNLQPPFEITSVPGYNSGIAMDMDMDCTPSQSLPAFFYPNEQNSQYDDFVDPNVIGGAEQSTSGVSRMWPGMHSQQAEQAKAEALARQQRQQQHMQQLRQPSEACQQSFSQPAARSSAQQSADPLVEERISRLLDSMRNNSSSSEGDSNSLNDHPSHIARMRKEEEDMDEDERLLASEEGKKLSSKERRQLRNKVSARAFRSRRKEYIGQLEGEVAVKVNECNELKTQNRNLMDQNHQLTRLTQYVLRHPAFASVLADMSRDPSIIGQVEQAPSSAPIRPPPTSAPREVQPYITPTKQETEPQSNETTQVGLSMVPESNLDFSMLNLGRNHWANRTGLGFQQPSVFSVMELPAGPAVDHFSSESLSGKGLSNLTCIETESKMNSPIIAVPPFQQEIAKPQWPAPTPISDIDESDPCFALYRNLPSSLHSPSCAVVEAVRMLEMSLCGKSLPQFRMSVTGSDNTMTPIQKIEQMFDSLEPACSRVHAMTLHLPECS